MTATAPPRPATALATEASPASHRAASPAWPVVEMPAGWLAGARSAWNGLLTRSRADPVFMSFEWIAAVDDAFGGARVLAVRRGGDVVGLMPLFRFRSRASLGAAGWSLALAERTGADYADVVCEHGHEAPVADALASHLATEQGWARIAFDDVLPESVARAVANRLAPTATVEDAPGSACPRIGLVSGFEGYLGERFARKHRYNLKRQLRLAEASGMRLVVHERPDAIVRAYPQLETLHLARKRALRVPSTFAEGPSAAFHRAAADRLAPAGLSLIAQLDAGGETLAAAYALRARDTLHYFQTGISAAGLAAGAGSTLLLMLVRWAAAQGYRSVDLLKGDEGYKAALATDIVRERRLAVTPRNALGAAQRVAARAYRAMRGAPQGARAETEDLA